MNFYSSFTYNNQKLETAQYSKCLSTGKWINKFWYIRTMDLPLSNKEWTIDVNKEMLH